MELYVVFGSNHVHRVENREGKLVTMDADVVGVVEADTYGQGRAKLFDLFGPKFAFCYESKPDMHYYSRGVIEL